ncbi:MAG: hypothetical protein KKB91_04215 [Proteobacteria bacterium]|jgi:hypothetical protein|nr:hypothetical protein [Desulfocapsa sp.]MBU3945063.1 hypothetical protein [Pseudomonadota bacterium]MCG2743721.1 hypothetical protein [Desulfobacteraceae bacterium]MDO8948735.1 hypothetical protein [Desulfocapsaceae bacterium]MBU4027593.1 hypothetical protein [Pseudomonadota bacterium]
MKSPSKRPRSLLFPAFVLILLTTATLWFLFNRRTPPPPPESSAVSEKLEAEPSTALTHDLSESINPTTLSMPLGKDGLPPGAPDNLTERTDSTPLPTLPSKEQLPLATERINAFYQNIDQQEYIKAHHLSTPISIHITSLLQKILDNPPVVTRETDDLLTILKNSAHFFRILGKDNILLIKEILNQDKDKIEEVMANYALILTEKPDSLGNDLSLKIPDNALYEYACFFLNTMGGKLYLARRDSLSRMLVSYYAIQIIHQANIEEKNKYGLQLQPAIDLLTSEIEISGNPLHYKEAYLDTLYDLKEKYQ